MGDSENRVKPHALLLSSPGLGHLIPVLELGYRLATRCGFHVTLFAVTSHASVVESETLQAAAAHGPCEITQLSPVDVTKLVQPNAKLTTKLAVMMREMTPTIRSGIMALRSKPDAFIVDLFGTELLTLAEDIGLKKYVFIASHAWFLALTVYMPVLDKAVEGEYIDKKEPFEIPGCRSVRPDEVVDPMLDRTNQQYREYLQMGLDLPKADGVLVNTWEELQGKTLDAMRDGGLLARIMKTPVYPIGPMVRPVGPAGSREWIFGWLDRQPKESVLYVCLGSGGTLSSEQMTELAWGLELSGQRFVWVVRHPTVRTGDGCFFTTGSGDDDVSGYLPNGFSDRTRNLGLLVPEWAPQANILSHESIGGFLSHCGWNSTMESITNGVAMIAWPLYAEQRMNATLLTEDLRVAVRSKTLPAEGVIRREEIREMVRKIMVDEEGYETKAKAKELKRSAEKAWLEGGSSCYALSEWAKRCRA